MGQKLIGTLLIGLTYAGSAYCAPSDCDRLKADISSLDNFTSSFNGNVNAWLLTVQSQMSGWGQWADSNIGKVFTAGLSTPFYSSANDVATNISIINSQFSSMTGQLATIATDAKLCSSGN